MKKILFLATLLACFATGTSAQKYALIDLEYILKQIPQYEAANKQIEALAEEGQKAVEARMNEVKGLYEAYQKATNLSASAKSQKEEEILEKEKSVQELRQSYFGEEGQLARKQKELILPIQDQVYEAVKSVALQEGYMMVIDRSSSTNIIFASPQIDVSDQVLSVLGYSK